MLAPHLAQENVETYETNLTDKLTNHEFLSVLFGDRTEDTCPVIVSFSGNPQTVSKSSWFGYGWTADAPVSAEGNNNYFSLATFRPDESGTYRRRTEQFVALHVIMLDDIGMKITRDRLGLPPSWMLETSPGNYQAGYILDEPIKDKRQANALVKAIIKAGLCDPGANGPTARLARLPVAVNGKHDPAFPCQMEAWNPDLRYSVEDLVNGLSLDMVEKTRPKRINKEEVKRPDGGEEIYIPRPEENTVIAALKGRGLYKLALGSGKHDITCPWVAEHTDVIDSGTAYFEPDDAFPIGGFKCHHGHCAQRNIRNLLENLSISPNTASLKPIIKSIAGELYRVCDSAEKELAALGKFYQRGGLIVTVTTDPSLRDTSIKEISQPALLSGLSSAAIWMRYDGRSKDWVRIDPPASVVSVVYAATDYKHLAPLNGLAHQPYLRTDGTLATNPGYDPHTGMYGIFEPERFRVPEKPSKQDAQDALNLISDLLTEFAFPKESDRSAAVSAILTACIRPSLRFAPMFHVRAPQIGSGKSFLCQLITAFATTRRGSPATFPHDDEECRKFLLAELLRAPAVIEFDNLTSDLISHKSLCSALTSESLTGRILGISKTTTVSTRTLFLSSGNNVSPVGDMTRRCVTINLDPACEIPAARTFKKPNLLSELHHEREKYVSAALTVIRAWIIAGRPKTDSKSIGSYGDWSELCQQPLLWLGLPDPIDSIFEGMNDDPEREILGRLLQAWKSCFGTTPKMIRDAVNYSGPLGSGGELYEIMSDIAADRSGTINRLVMGKWIKRNTNRIVDGLRFIAVSGSRSAAAYRVESVS